MPMSQQQQPIDETDPLTEPGEMQLSLCILSLLLCSALAFKQRFSSSIRKPSSIFRRQAIILTPETIDDTDSSEMEFTSSSDLRRKRESEEKEQIAAVLKKSRDLHNDSEKTLTSEITPPPTAPAPKPTPVVTASSVSAVSSVSTAVVKPAAAVPAADNLSNVGGSFDIGLYLAFPIMIATLAFFFLFPFLRDSIGSSLPPVPLD